MPNPRQSELGDFLRSRREKLTPKAVGLPEGRRRRTPGLRREEVAELAGIGVDWYIRLEQGRTVTPSVATIDALARALRLGKAEHAHFRALTQTADRRAFVPETVPAMIRRLVESLNQPAYISGRRWDILPGTRPRTRSSLSAGCPSRSQHPDLRADQSARPGGCSGRHGPTWRGASWRSSRHP